MSTLNLKSIATLVSDQAAAIQAKASALIDFSTGSILRAVAEANASLGVWLQGLILQLLLVTRAATSTGTDLDSFVNDYGVFRLSASIAAGSETFSRFTPTNSAVVPIGAQVQTADGTQTFNVIVDTTNPAYSASAGGYLIPIGVTSVSCAVQSANAGTSANVVAGAVNVLTTVIPGIDFVSNAAAMGGGSNAETDPQLRARFILFIASLSKATAGAIGYAITSLQLGVQYTLTPNQDYSGGTHYGFFYAVIDDGTGNPPTSLLNAVYAAIDAVRGFTIQFAVFPPVVTTANVSMTCTVAQGYDGPTVKGQVGDAVITYISNLGLGNGLNYTRLAQIAFDASPGVVDITNLLLNSGTTDIAANNQNTIKPGTVAVN